MSEKIIIKSVLSIDDEKYMEDLVRIHEYVTKKIFDNLEDPIGDLLKNKKIEFNSKSSSEIHEINNNEYTMTTTVSLSKEMNKLFSELPEGEEEVKFMSHDNKVLTYKKKTTVKEI